MTSVPERADSLWMLTVSPTIWAAHLLLSYATGAIWCAKLAGPDGALGGARLAIAIYTAVALLGIGVTGAAAYRRQRRGGGRETRGADTPEDRHRFLGFATLLLSWLSAVAILYAAAVVAFVERCH